jgi:hypothetical protein
MSVSYLSETQALGVYDVRDYLAVGNGVADDTAAIQAACLAAHTAGGGTVVFPPGTYKCDAALDLRGYYRVELRGMGNASHIGGAATLRYTGTAATFLSLHSSFAVKLRNLRFEYTSASFTGDLIGYGWYAGAVYANADPGYGEIDGCYFAGDATHTTGRSGIMLDHAIIVNIHDCHFSYLDAGILGRSANTLYAIVIQVRNCTFTKLVTAGIRNPHQAWLIEGCTSEPLTNNKCGFIWMDTTYAGQGTTIRGNWVGDASVNGGTVIRWNGLGCAIVGNYLTASANSPSGDKLIEIHSGAVSDGIHIAGNFLFQAQYGIDFAGAAHRGVLVGPNYFNVTTAITGDGALTVADFFGNENNGAVLDRIINALGLAVTGPLSVSGALTATATLAVTGTSTLSGAVSAPTSLAVGSGGTAIKKIGTSSVNIDPPSIAANTRGTATGTITGVAVGDTIFMNPPGSLEAGLLFVGCNITGADTVTVTLYNATAGAIDGASKGWTYEWHDLT